MIVETVIGDVFESSRRHIVFGVNTEGRNDVGFAGQVARRFNPGLVNTGGNELGEVLTFTAENKIFHAVVCHSLAKEPGWSKTPEVLRDALDTLAVDDDEPIAAVMIGGGLMGHLMGADVTANLAAMEQSNKKFYVYSI